MRPDLVKSILFIAACAAIGFTFGYPLELALISAVASNYWILRKASKLHQWLHTRKAQPDSEEGVFYYLHRDMREIFDSNHQEKRVLQQTLKKFRDASSVLPDAVVVFDEHGNISWANKLSGHLLGIYTQRDVGQRITNILRSPKFVEALDAHDIEPLNIDIPAPLQMEQMLNLKIVDLSQNTRMLVARDITRLTNINKGQKDFVSNVSHELKTPLTVMRGYLEMLRESPELPDKLMRPFDDMMAQTQRMQSIIEDLLYLAKLEGQPIDIIAESHTPISIDDLIDTVMDTAKPLAKQNNQTLHIDIDTDLSVIGNTSELQIAFNNLVINALRYTPEGGKIKVKWFERDQHAVFSVQDNGIGIAPNQIDRITERFYRVDQGRSRAKGGTGLGLAIVKNILDRHQAKLTIESNLGSGSRFECIFNTITANPAELASLASTKATKPSPTPMNL